MAVADVTHLNESYGGSSTAISDALKKVNKDTLSSFGIYTKKHYFTAKKGSYRVVVFCGGLGVASPVNRGLSTVIGGDGDLLDEESRGSRFVLFAEFFFSRKTMTSTP